MLSPCVATVDPKTKASAAVAPPTLAPSTKKTTSPECSSVPLLVQQQGRDGRDGRDGLPGLVGPSGTKGEKGDPGIVVQGATGRKGTYMYVRSSLLKEQSSTMYKLGEC